MPIYRTFPLDSAGRVYRYSTLLVREGDPAARDTVASLIPGEPSELRDGARIVGRLPPCERLGR